MIEILPIQTKSEQEAVCLRFGVNYDPELLAYGAYENGETVGICQFRLSSSGGLVYDIAGSESELYAQNLFLLGRSTLAFLDECGQENAEYVGEVRDDAFRVILGAVGFKPDKNGKYTVSLLHFFDSPCQRKNPKDK